MRWLEGHVQLETWNSNHRLISTIYHLERTSLHPIFAMVCWVSLLVLLVLLTVTCYLSDMAHILVCDPLSLIETYQVYTGLTSKLHL